MTLQQKRQALRRCLALLAGCAAWRHGCLECRPKLDRSGQENWTRQYMGPMDFEKQQLWKKAA